LIIQLNDWKEKIVKSKSIRVRDLARLLGTLNFTRLQFPQASLHMHMLNRVKSKAVNKEDWEARIVIHKGTLREINWWKDVIRINKPKPLVLLPFQASMTTDAS
jgi:hypothetical protein